MYDSLVIPRPEPLGQRSRSLLLCVVAFLWAGTGGGSDAEGGPDGGANEICVDGDGDGYGPGCALGDDCNDDAEACTTFCGDSDNSGTADCQEPLGGGFFLLATEHGRYRDHQGATEFLSDLGSTMTAVDSLNPGTYSFFLQDIPNDLLTGISTLSVFYSASIEIGDGLAVGTTDNGEVDRV